LPNKIINLILYPPNGLILRTIANLMAFYKKRYNESQT